MISAWTEFVAGIPGLGKGAKEEIKAYLSEPVPEFPVIEPCYKKIEPVRDSKSNPYFVYQSLFHGGQPYIVTRDGTYATANLPRKYDGAFGSRREDLRRKFFLVEQLQLDAIREARREMISTQLEELYRENGFVERVVGSYPLMGTCLDHLCNILFVPGEVVAETNEKVNHYLLTVRDLFEPIKVGVGCRLRPVADGRYTPRSFFFRYDKKEKHFVEHPFSTEN